MQSFISNAGICASQVAVMFVFIITGYLLSKRRVLTETGIREMTALVLWVVNPCMIVSSFISVDYSAEITADILRSLAVTAFFFALALAVIIPLFSRAPEKRRNVLRYAAVFSNCGFMALPLTNALFGAKGTACVSVFVAVFNLLTWTVGVRLYGGKLNVRRALLNPGTIGLAAGLLLYFLPYLIPGFRIFSPVESCISMASAVNTPLAMIIVGTFLAGCSLRPEKGDGYTLLCVLMRLIVLPAVTYILLRLIAPASFSYVIAVLMIPISASVAANTALFAVQFERDAPYASKLVSISTLLCIVTMPLIIAGAMMNL